MQSTTCRADKQQGPTVEPGNYIQYPVINHNGKDYVKLTHFAVQQKSTQHRKSTILQ